MLCIAKWFIETYSLLKMENLGLKIKNSSLKMDSITVIKQKALTKQRDIKGYYKLGKAELMQQLEAHPDVIKASFNPGIRYTQKHDKISEYQSILDNPILDDTTCVLQPTPKFIGKSMQRSKISVTGCWITFRQNQKWLMKLSNRLKI